MLWNSLIIYRLHLIIRFSKCIISDHLMASSPHTRAVIEVRRRPAMVWTAIVHSANIKPNEDPSPTVRRCETAKKPAACGSLRTWPGSDSAVSRAVLGGRVILYTVYMVGLTLIYWYNEMCSGCVVALFSQKMNRSRRTEGLGRRGAKKEKKEKEKSGSRAASGRVPFSSVCWFLPFYHFIFRLLCVFVNSASTLE